MPTTSKCLSFLKERLNLHTRPLSVVCSVVSTEMEAYQNKRFPVDSTFLTYDIRNTSRKRCAWHLYSSNGSIKKV